MVLSHSINFHFLGVVGSGALLTYFHCWGILQILIIIGPTKLAVGMGQGYLDIFLSPIISFFFLPLSLR